MFFKCTPELLFLLEESDIIEKFQDHVDWNMVSEQFHSLTESFISKFQDKIVWSKIDYDKLNYKDFDFFAKFQEKLNWTLISQVPKLEPEFLEYHANVLDMKIVSRTQTLSGCFVQKYKDELDMRLVSQYQTLTIDTINSLGNCLDLDLLSQYQDLSEEFIVDYHLVIDIKAAIQKYWTLHGPESTRQLWHKIIGHDIKDNKDIVLDYMGPGTTGLENLVTYMCNHVKGKNFDYTRIEKLPLVILVGIFSARDWNDFSREFTLSSLSVSLFCDYVNWEIVSGRPDLTRQLVKDHHEKIHFEQLEDNVIISIRQDLPEFHNLPELFIMKLLQKNLISYHTTSQMKNLSESFISAFADNLYWSSILKNNDLSEAMLAKHHDKLDWHMVAQYQNVSEDFIKQYESCLDWNLLCQYTQMSARFIGLNHDKVDWKLVGLYQKSFGASENPDSKTSTGALTGAASKGPLSVRLIDWSKAMEEWGL